MKLTHYALVVPAGAWHTLIETLQRDAQSSAFSPELRAEIARALDFVSECPIGESQARRLRRHLEKGRV
jgi:hypothetical protein